MRHAALLLALAGCSDATMSFDPTQLSHRSDLAMENTFDMILRGDHLYVAAGDSELAVVDVSDPLTMVEVGRWTSGKGSMQTTALLPLGDHLVMAVDWDVYVFDVSDPTSPQVISKTGTEVHIVGLALSGDTLAVWGDGVNPELDRLYVLDLSDPAAPVLGGSVPFDWARSAVGGVGGGLFVGGAPDEGDGGGLALLDASDLSAPSFGEPSSAPGGFVMGIRDDLAYVKDQRDLHVIDVRDPKAPSLVFSRDLVSFGRVLFVEEYVGITTAAGVSLFPADELETLPTGFAVPVPSVDPVQALAWDGAHLFLGVENALFMLQERPD